MIKVLIIGPAGHLAGDIFQACWEAEGIEIAGAVGPKGRDYIGKDAGFPAKLGKNTGIIVSDDIEDVIDKCDIVIDCAKRETAMESLKACMAHKKAFLTGITGFSQEESDQIKAASEFIPVLRAANTSYVTNVMYKLLQIAAQQLDGKAKIEIVDYHSETKLDAPSGTALEMRELMEEASPSLSEGDITCHSVRAGTTPSQHAVIFGAKGERLEIVHTAYDWKCYAAGIVDAIRVLADKGPGYYTMADVIKFN